QAFPFVILTSNGERDFPPPFLRRCIRLTMPEPDSERLKKIVEAHFETEKDILQKAKPIIDKYQELQKKGELATDQLLNVIYLVTQKDFPYLDKEQLIEKLLQYISNVL
nr:MoxR family ATPase [Nostocaceae cyanobacterium]